MISIHARLALSLLIGSAVLTGAGGMWLDARVRETFEAQHDAALISRAWALANALQGDDGKIELEALHGLGAALQASQRPLYFQVWHGDGSIAGRSPTLGAANLPRLTVPVGSPCVVDVALPPEGRSGRAAGVQMELFDEHDETEGTEATLDAPAAAAVARTPIDRLTIVVAEDSRDLEAAMSTLHTSIFAFATISFVISALYLGWSLKRGLAPLTRLAESARKLEPGSLLRGIGHEELPRELAPVRDRLNELLARVHTAFAYEQRFTAALAHELRTPVAELRTCAEVALRRDDGTSDRRLHEDVLAVAMRMQGVIESLLALRRAESGSVDIEVGRVELDALIEDVLAQHVPAAERKNVECVCSLGSGTIVRSNEELLRTVLSNLLANAIEYCPPDTRVRIAIAAADDRVDVAVHNLAPALTAADVANMFEPFWRKDGGGSDARHSGVGLTLARSVARALGCELFAELDPRAELELRLTGLRIARD